jgi:hypothetical protein
VGQDWSKCNTDVNGGQFVGVNITPVPDEVVLRLLLVESYGW